MSRRRRYAVTAVAIMSLVLLWLRPRGWQEIEASTAVLLTPGTSWETYTDADVEVFGIGLGEATGRGETIPDLAYLTRHHPEIERLRVQGHGLPAWEWEIFPGELEFHPPDSTTAGVRDVRWTRRIHRGDDLIVEGVVSGAPAGALRLEGPGGNEKTWTFDGDEQPFILRARPRDAGRFLYRLVFETPDGRVSEDVDVDVRHPPPIAALWLEDAPGFETRHFKRWWIERGGVLALRSRLSRDRFRTEYHDHPRVELSPLAVELLADFDLVIADPPSLAALSSTELTALSSAVAETGLGVLVLIGPDEPEDPKAWWWTGLEAVADLDEMSITAVWPGAEPTTPLVVPARQLAPRRGLDPVVFDDAGRVLAATRIEGAGTIGWTLVAGSYRWVLEGRAEHHGRYWSRLVSALARRSDGARFHLPDGPILVDDPLEIVVETTAAAPQLRLERPPEEAEPLVLELRQDAYERHRYTARYWPLEPGWHRLTLDSGDTPDDEMAIHVVDAERWPAWQEGRRRDATRQHAVFGGATEGTGERPTWRRELPRWWFYAAFLASVGYLWLDERWGRRRDA